MKKNNAIITIVNNSGAFGDEGIEFATVGSFYEKDGIFYIMYDETEEMGMADCSVMVKISPDEVTVSRKGAFNSKMQYLNQKSTQFIYHMPYGSMSVGLYTKKIKCDLNCDGGKLGLFYTLEIQGEKHDHLMTIRVKKNS